MRRSSCTAFALSLVFLCLGACVDEKQGDQPEAIVLDARGSTLHSSTAGNLVTTAMQDAYQLDMVFYPTAFLKAETFAIIEPGLDAQVIESKILPFYPDDKRDDFMIGTLSGAEIRKFLIDRTSDNYQIDLQVAGIEYDVQYTGGLPTLYQIGRPHGLPLEDDKNYRIAISRQQYGIPFTFPGYQYRNNFEQAFEREPGTYSARTALKTFLGRFRQMPLLSETRAQIRQRVLGTAQQPLSIPEIQGRSHLSPWMGYKVRTQGLVTAVASKPDGGMEMYIQTPEDDGDPLTSQALNVYLDKARIDLKPGQLIEVTGIVYEIRTSDGLTRTAIREVEALNILASDQALPAAIAIGGSAGLKIPSMAISSYRGNINQKPQLNLGDGVDFWESLEAMRIRVAKPRVVGFRGGNEKFDDEKVGYLSVFVTAEGSDRSAETTAANGTFLDPSQGNYTPEVMRIVANELAPQVTTDLVFNVGDRFDYDLEGILSFQTNTFGSGEYVLFVTGAFGSSRQRTTPMEERPITRLQADAEHLTVASWNVENLGGDKKERIKRIAQAIRVNLLCPDIVTLPEIQDNNGIDFDGGSAADQTLAKLVDGIKCPNATYKVINIDPVPNQDGGEPGGNIRVAMIYNAQRIGFEQTGTLDPLTETFVQSDGSFNQNPGRLLPNDAIFKRSRKPLVAEFSFLGQRFVTIGNHLNSKLGDSSLWRAEQPAEFKSEIQRSRIANGIHDFVAQYLQKNPGAPVLVSGDFNAYWFENSMSILAGSSLKNLMTYESLVPANSWYTTNYDGGASAIDTIFASEGFLQRQPEYDIVHINSDFMGKLSDHDPVIARFNFGAVSR